MTVERVPLVTLTSSLVKPEGASSKVKVTDVVSPALSDELPVAMVNDGA